MGHAARDTESAAQHKPTGETAPVSQSPASLTTLAAASAQAAAPSTPPAPAPLQSAAAISLKPSTARAVVGMPGWQVSIVVGLLIAVFLSCNVVFDPWESNDFGTIWRAFAIGTALVEIVLLAIWAILAPQRSIDRLTSAGLLVGAVVCSYALGELLDRGYVTRDVWERAVMLVIWFVLSLAIVWLISPRFHWRIWRMSGTHVPRVIDGRSGHQFTVRRLLLWTALAAALLGVATRVFPSRDVILGESNIWAMVVDDVMRWFNQLNQPSVFLFLAVTLACLPLTLANRRWNASASLVALAACGMGVVGLHDMEDEWRQSDWFQIGHIMLAAACAMTVSLFFVRACGFRVAVSKRDEDWLDAQLADQPTDGSTTNCPPRRTWLSHWRFPLSAALLLVALAAIGWQAIGKMPDWTDHWLESTWSGTGLDATYQDGRLVRLDWLRGVNGNNARTSAESMAEEWEGKLTAAQLSLILQEESVPRLYLGGAEVSDEQLDELAHVRGLKEVSFASASITDSRLVHLKHLPLSEELDLSGSSITDAGLEQLATMSAIKMLDLSRTNITDAGLVHLEKIPNLKVINLAATAVTDAGLVDLAKAQQLEDVNLSVTAVTDAGLRPLASLQGLTYLNVSETAVTDAGLVHLSRCAKLWRLQLDGTQITDAGMVHLASLPALAELSLDETSITDAGLMALARCGKLQRLDVAGAHVTPDGVQKLEAALPQAAIRAPNAYSEFPNPNPH